MTDEHAKAREDLDEEFAKVRDHLEEIRTALAVVEHAGPTDDLAGLLERLEEAVHQVRTGGLLGSGANGHRDALERLRRLEAF